MAEHGFVGLFLFLSLMGGLAYSGFRLKKRCKPYPELHWAGDLGVKLSVSILLYLGASAFLAVSTHPITYDLAVLSMAVITIVNREIAGYQEAKRSQGSKLRFVSAPPAGPSEVLEDVPSDETGGANASEERSKRRSGPLSYMERRRAAMAASRAGDNEPDEAAPASRSWRARNMRSSGGE